jgi:hypothetical protein
VIDGATPVRRPMFAIEAATAKNRDIRGRERQRELFDPRA